jgi:RimJ/RimL family protein N-acetyltransferase
MNKTTPVLRTERYVLRELTRADAGALFPTFADPDSMRWWSRGPFRSEEELRAWLVPEDGWAKGRSWAILAHREDEVIGRLAAIDRGDDVTELGYIVGLNYRQRGVAREAVIALIDHLIRSESRRRLCADVDPDNVGSNRLLESLGFRLEGRLRENWTTHIGRRDSLIWGLLAPEWLGRSRTQAER